MTYARGAVSAEINVSFLCASYHRDRRCAGARVFLELSRVTDRRSNLLSVFPRRIEKRTYGRRRRPPPPPPPPFATPHSARTTSRIPARNSPVDPSGRSRNERQVDSPSKSASTICHINKVNPSPNRKPFPLRRRSARPRGKSSCSPSPGEGGGGRGEREGLPPRLPEKNSLGLADSGA